MATISVTLGPVTVSKTLTAAQTTRVVDALKFLHGQGSTSEVLTKECENMLLGLLSTVRGIEHRVATEAVPLPAPLDPT